MKKLVIMMAIVVAMSGSAMAAIIVDSFDVGPQYVSAGGGGIYGTPYVGAGVLGGQRDIYCRNASSQIARLDINGGNVSAPGEVLSTAPNGGGALRIIGWGQSNNGEANWGANTPLNLNLPDDATIEVDVAEVISNHNDPNGNYPQIRLFFNGGANRAEYKLGLGTVTAVPQTVVIPDLMAPDWSSAGSVTSADLDDIDGIRLFWYDSYETRITEVRINDGSAPPIPEPAGLGLIGLALLAVRRRRG